LNGFQVPVGIEEGADVGEGEAAILLENCAVQKVFNRKRTGVGESQAARQ
jgi:hypothetical protein